MNASGGVCTEDAVSLLLPMAESDSLDPRSRAPALDPHLPPGMHVFLTVGSTRFDALVQAALDQPVLDALNARGYRSLDVQCGNSDFDTAQLQQLADDHWQRTAHTLDINVWRFKPSLKQDYERADLIISHAGIPSFPALASPPVPPTAFSSPGSGTIIDVLVSCTASTLRHIARATALKTVVIKHRTKSTLSGSKPSTSSPPAVPGSLGTGRPRYAKVNRSSASRTPKVSTLDLTRITSDNFLDLSGQVAAQARAYRSEERQGGEHWRFIAKIRAAGMDNLVFPPNARGFLYYHLVPNSPALSGQVRFRVTGVNDPALFSTSEDLLRADHLPWRIPVISLPFHKYYTTLLRRLVDDGLVSEHLSRVISSLPPEAQTANVGSTRIVHALNQPFLLYFGQFKQPFYFVGTDTVRRVFLGPVAIHPDINLRLPTLTGARLPSFTSYVHCDHRTATNCDDVHPGSALCRFEKSTRPEHAGRRVVVCRVVRILKPMKRTGLCSIPHSVFPREGELIYTTFPAARDSPWSCDIDYNLSLAPDTAGARFAAGLDLLYDNEARAGGPVGW